MQDAFVLVVVGFGALFSTLMLISDKEPHIFAALGLVCWFATAGSVAAVDIPYAVENMADNTVGTVITGTHSVTANAPYAYLFMSLGLFCLVYLFILVFRGLPKIISGRGEGV